MSFKATPVHHFLAGHVHTPQLSQLSHSRTHAHTCTYLVIALCNRGGLWMRSCKASHVRLNNLRSDTTTCNTPTENVAQLPNSPHVFGHLRNYVNLASFHVFLSQKETSSLLSLHSHTVTPVIIKTCTTNTYQRRMNAATVWRYSTWLHHVSTHRSLLHSMNKDCVQRACRTLPPVERVGIT